MQIPNSDLHILCMFALMCFHARVHVFHCGLALQLQFLKSWVKLLHLLMEHPEMLWFGSASQLRGLRPDTMHITINQSTIKPVTVVRDLGVLFDGELSMRQQVSRLSHTCFYHLRRLRSAYVP